MMAAICFSEKGIVVYELIVELTGGGVQRGVDRGKTSGAPTLLSFGVLI